MSHKPCPIKVVDTALSKAMKADGIAKETAETRKVTAVVMVMNTFKRKRCKLQSSSLKNERPSCQRAERAEFCKKISADCKTFSKFKKRLDTKEISI
jgi:hypothetical protein